MNSKRGSALLIVLGFLAFMVVSAVSFSIWMRQERVPSSAYRSGVATRHLMHAALARAISHIDDAIRDDPFPGVINATSHREEENTSDGYIRFYDKWLGRVFMPVEPIETVDGIKNIEERYRVAPRTRPVSATTQVYTQEDLAPVLTLEALGYLPPSLINDVRFLSKISWSAKWEYLNFDAGRVAYTAVNVSDFFDINRLKANTNRNSGVEGRISLAYLMSLAKNESRVDVPTVSDCQNFDRFVAERGNNESDYPFVSMLDYNISMKNGIGNFISPFYSYIGKSGSATLLSESDKRKVVSQKFITDSYFNTTNLVDNRVKDLSITLESDPHYGQPFKPNETEGGESLAWLLGHQLPDPLTGGIISMADRAALYDYLDRDDVPTSLALPTVERTPMVVAVDASQLRLSLHAENQYLPGPDANTYAWVDAATKEKVKQTIKYSLASDFVLPGAVVGATVIFPFKRARELTNGNNYKAQLIAKVCFVRQEGGSIKTRTGMTFGDDTLLKPKMNDWNGGANTEVSDHVITMRSEPTTVNLKEVVTEEEAYTQVTIPFTLNPPNGGDLANYPLFSVTKTWKAKVVTDETGAVVGHDPVPQDVSKPESTLPAIGFETSAFLPFKQDFTGLDLAAGSFEGDVEKFVSQHYTPMVAIWVRITDRNGDVVDLVPATFADDEQNDITANRSFAGAANACGEFEPILRFAWGDNGFDASHSLIYAESRLSALVNGADNQEWGYKNAQCVDPRYNYAPEGWFWNAGGSIAGQTWYNNIKTAYLDNSNCDPDIFMFVSNQGYLQSISELSFLARTGRMESGQQIFGDLNSALFNGDRAIKADDIRLKDFAWRTYRLFPLVQASDNGSDYLFDLDVIDGDGGFRVNPYTDDPQIFMAALANTPYDWWAAGTNTMPNVSNNKTVSLKNQMAVNLSQGLKYCFNQECDELDVKLTYSDLEKLAKWMMSEFKSVKDLTRWNGSTVASKAAADWLDVFDSWDWSGLIDSDKHPDPFGPNGAQITNFGDSLSSVDRKFLYAFWRNCFANRQQLFLIFTRAESTSIGGQGEKQTPSQLGGRAVALVWRDPKTPVGGNDKATRTARPGSYRPHRTRILFYHQFD